MARIRYLKPDFFKDEDLALLPFPARFLFAGLWGLADKAGRLEDRVLRIKAEIFPYESVDVEENLKLLSKPKNGSGHPFIIRYQLSGQNYIQILSWNKHQKPHHTEKESNIPPFNGKGNGKIKEKQLEASCELTNGELTVKSTPTVKEVRDYCEERANDVDPDKWHDSIPLKVG